VVAAVMPEVAAAVMPVFWELNSSSQEEAGAEEEVSELLSEVLEAVVEEEVFSFVKKYLQKKCLQQARGTNKKLSFSY
jgi:hypothetical protein